MNYEEEGVRHRDRPKKRSGLKPGSARPREIRPICLKCGAVRLCRPRPVLG